MSPSGQSSTIINLSYQFEHYKSCFVKKNISIIIAYKFSKKNCSVTALHINFRVIWIQTKGKLKYNLVKRCLIFAFGLHNYLFLLLTFSLCSIIISLRGIMEASAKYQNINKIDENRGFKKPKLFLHFTLLHLKLYLVKFLIYLLF